MEMLVQILLIVAIVLASLVPVLLGHMKFKEWLTVKVLLVDELYFGESGDEKFYRLLDSLIILSQKIKNPMLYRIIVTVLSNKKLITFYVKSILAKYRPVTEQSKVTKATIASNAIKDATDTLIKKALKVEEPQDLLDGELALISDKLQSNHSYIKGYAKYNTKDKTTVGVEGVKYFK